jgi:rare lipoprotein A
MRPYTIFGKRYYPTKVRVGEKFNGISSWYGPDFDGKATSSNGKSVVVRINDRGPFVGTRIIDLSNKAAHQIDMVKKGTANVRLEVIGFKDQKSRERGSKHALKSTPKEALSYETYAIQIGSFSKIDGALKVQGEFDGYRGHPTIIKDTEYNGKRVFRVWLDGFRSEAEARTFKADSPFQNAFIVGE